MSAGLRGELTVNASTGFTGKHRVSHSNRVEVNYNKSHSVRKFLWWLCDFPVTCVNLPMTGSQVVTTLVIEDVYFDALINSQ